MAQSKEKFVVILNEALRKIRSLTSEDIYKIELQLAEAIHLSPEMIEKWRRVKHKQMPSLEQAEIVAKLLIEKRGLVGRGQFEEFLDCAGHPYAAQAWIRLFWRIEGPEPVEHFTGRERETEDLIAALQVGEVVSLCGVAGVGKTALVAKVRQLLVRDDKPPKQFSHGIFYHDFYSEPAVDALFEHIAKSFREAAQRALFDCEALLILDGAEEAIELNKILSIRGRCGVLLITREKRIARGKTIFLDVLPLEQSIHVLQAWSSDEYNPSKFNVWHHNQGPNDDNAKDICELLGRLPLALRLAGRYMAETSTTPTEMLQILKATPRPLSVLYDPDVSDENQHKSIVALLKKILQTMSKSANKVIAVVGLLSYTPFHIDTIVSALEATHLSVQDSLREMIRFGLIRRTTEHFYQFVHRLIHVYAQKHVIRSKIVLERLEQYYIGFIETQDSLAEKGYTRFEIERAHLMSVLDRCVELRKWEWALNLVSTAEPYLEKHHSDQTLRLRINEIGYEAICEVGDQQQQYKFLAKLRLLCECTKQIEKAIDYQQQVLALFREMGDLANEYSELCYLASLYQHIDLNLIEQAISCHQQALAVAHRLGDYDKQNDELHTLGDLYHELGQVEEAIGYYQKALALALEVGNYNRQNQELYALGKMYQQLGQTELWNNCYQQAADSLNLLLTQEPENGNKDRERNRLSWLALVYKGLGKIEQSIKYLQHALRITREADGRDFLQEIALLSELSHIHSSLDQVEQANDYDQQRKTVIEEMNDFYRKEAQRNLAHLEIDWDQIEREIEQIPLDEGIKALRQRAEEYSVLAEIREPEPDPFELLIQELREKEQNRPDNVS